MIGIALNEGLFLLGLRWHPRSPWRSSRRRFPSSLRGSRSPHGRRRSRGGPCSGWPSRSPAWWLTGRGALDLGALVVAVNSLSFAAYVVLSREDAVRRLGAVRVVAWVFTYGALLFSPIGLLPAVHQVFELGPRGWAFVVYIVVVPTIVAYALNAWALARSSPTLSSMVYICLQLLLAAALARVQLGQSVSGRAGVAALLILGGLGVVAAGDDVELL